MARVFIRYELKYVRMSAREFLQVLVPSLDLLTSWHMQYGLVYERNADWQTAGVYPQSPLTGQVYEVLVRTCSLTLARSADADNRQLGL